MSYKGDGKGGKGFKGGDKGGGKNLKGLPAVGASWNKFVAKPNDQNQAQKSEELQQKIRQKQQEIKENEKKKIQSSGGVSLVPASQSSQPAMAKQAADSKDELAKMAADLKARLMGSALNTLSRQNSAPGGSVPQSPLKSPSPEPEVQVIDADLSTVAPSSPAPTKIALESTQQPSALQRTQSEPPPGQHQAAQMSLKESVAEQLQVLNQQKPAAIKAGPTSSGSPKGKQPVRRQTVKAGSLDQSSGSSKAPEKPPVADEPKAAGADPHSPTKVSAVLKEKMAARAARFASPVTPQIAKPGPPAPPPSPQLQPQTAQQLQRQQSQEKLRPAVAAAAGSDLSASSAPGKAPALVIVSDSPTKPEVSKASATSLATLSPLEQSAGARAAVGPKAGTGAASSSRPASSASAVDPQAPASATRTPTPKTQVSPSLRPASAPAKSPAAALGSIRADPARTTPQPKVARTTPPAQGAPAGSAAQAASAIAAKGPQAPVVVEKSVPALTASAGQGKRALPEEGSSKGTVRARKKPRLVDSESEAWEAEFNRLLTWFEEKFPGKRHSSKPDSGVRYSDEEATRLEKWLLAHQDAEKG